jgi:hypothetical protein
MKSYFPKILGRQEEVYEGAEVEGEQATIFQKYSSRTSSFEGAQDG